MTTTTRNEAAEPTPEYGWQCRERCLGVLNHSGPHQTTGYARALAAERRATVERIRTHLLSELPAPMAPGDEILWSTVVAILDEEEAR